MTPNQYSNQNSQHGQHLKFVKYSTPLFEHCYKAFPFSSPNATKYLVIPNAVSQKNHSISKFICPYFIVPEQNKTFIVLQGQCFSEYLHSRNKNICLMTEEQLWALIFCILKAVIDLSQHYKAEGLKHLKQYMIRRINNKHYKIIYHESIKLQAQAANQKHYKWYDFYLSPQELNGRFDLQKSTIFSLGYMILNICCFKDVSRNIYRQDSFDINWQIVSQKLRICRQFYSRELVNFIEMCLKQSPQDRLNYAGLMEYFAHKMENINDKKSILLSQIHLVNSTNNTSPISYNMSLSRQGNTTIDDINVYHKNQKETTRNYSISDNKNKLQSPVKVPSGKWAKKSRKRFQKLPSTSFTSQNNQTQSYSRNDCQTNKEKSILQTPYQKIQSSQYSQSIQQRQAPDKIQLKDQHNLINYRGTFGSRYLSEEQQQTIKKQSQPSKQQFNTLRKSVYNVQAKKQKPNLSINITNLHENLGQKQAIQTPKGFGIYSEQYTYPQYEIEHEKKHQVQFIQANMANHHGVDLPQCLTKYGTIQLTVCLKPLQELIKDIGEMGVWVEGDVYYGKFNRGHRNGLGLQIYLNGEYYYGYFKEDLFQGEGFYYWNKNQYFIGKFIKGQKYYGYLHGPVRYQGTFENSKRDGSGTCWYSNGETYKGQWLKGRREGKGIFIDINGDIFNGKWRKGKKNGDGQLQCKDFTIYGKWKNNQIEQEVLIKFSNGSQFQGKIGKNLQKIQGIYKSKSGRIYEGTFKNDEPHKGIMLYPNGDKYIGTFQNHLRHGYGQYYYANGEIYKGQWKENKKNQK